MFKYRLKPTKEKKTVLHEWQKTLFMVYDKFTHNLNITIAVWGMWIYFNKMIHVDIVCKK
jgi:hypothetical protein